MAIENLRINQKT